MEHATIKDLVVDPTAKLTPSSIKALEGIINDEFDNKRTMIDAGNEQKKEDIKEQYIKSVNAEAMIEKIKKQQDVVNLAQGKLTDLEKKLHLKGINTNGEVMTSWYAHQAGYTEYESREIGKKVDKVNKLLASVNDQDVWSLKNKIIARLHLASTKGEAAVILREVLGNGIIPTFSVNQLQITQQ